ncbi:MAG: pyridoxal 5'-phosphate synthase glutaminase subunit PdxT [Candidatus Heimdallarchaeota archaeon]|nr:pyridoxal 5'-phosphate synthase glutaminase subunit PdxT [Candidatus Heimdallarchaeota archaeon]
MSKKKEVQIGVLAVQGDVLEHVNMMNEILHKKGIKSNTILVRKPEQIEQLDGLIIPGGESTVMSRLVSEMRFDNKLVDTIREKVKNGMAILGTCAGTIMLSKTSKDYVVKDFSQVLLELMDIDVIRNKYGRQQVSFELPITIEGFGKQPFPGVFIRAPVITSVGKNVEILARNSEEIFAAKQGKLLAATFHPELTDDMRFHEYFLDLILS